MNLNLKENCFSTVKIVWRTDFTIYCLKGNEGNLELWYVKKGVLTQRN